MTGFSLCKCSDVMLRYSFQIYFNSSFNVSITDNLSTIAVLFSIFEINIRVKNNATDMGLLK